MSADLKKQYKYSTKIQAFAKAVPDKAKEKLKKEAIASLSNLSSVFADEDTIQKIKANPDLLFFASNLILCNYANLNDDCVTKEDVINMAKKFVLKQINIEHNRSEVRGAISEVGYSLFPSNVSINEEIAKVTNDPVQLVIGGYLWRVVDADLCNFIESASDENSPDYGSASTSFELFFNEYEIAVAQGEDRDLNKARIVSAEEFEKYDKMLRVNGGSGKDEDGNVVFRILRGDIHPAGAGIVARPASGLKGVLAITSSEQIEPEKEEDDDEEEDTEEDHDEHEMDDEEENKEEDEEDEESEASNQEKNINLEDTSVTANITSTNFNTEETMKIVIKSLEDLTSQWSELQKMEASASEQTVREYIEQVIAEKSVEFSQKLKEKEELIQTVEANKKAAETKVSELESAIAELKAELDKINTEKAAAEAEARFNARMTALDETFELEDEERSILVEEVVTIDSDESFASWMEKKKKLLKEKTKAYKKAKAEQENQTVATTTATASTTTTVVNAAEVVASVTETENQQISNTIAGAKDIKEQWAAAFSDGLVVNGVTAKEYLGAKKQ